MSGWVTGYEYPDDNLIKLASEGDRRAFELLANRHLAALGAYILSRTPTREDAEDIAQETLLAAWRGIAAYDGNSSVRTWLFAIARRKIADLYRSRYASPSAELDDDIPGDDGGLQTTAVAADLSEAVKRLGESERELVFLTYRAGLTCEEAATVTGIPVGTVKSRLSGARIKLKKYLGEGYND